MSLICTSNLGWLISHLDYISSLYEDTNDYTIKLKQDIFKINIPYAKNNHNKTFKHLKNKEHFQEFEKEINDIKHKYQSIYEEFKAHFQTCNELHNKEALKLSDEIYEETQKYLIQNACGENMGPSRFIKINNGLFVFPENCKFFCKDVTELSQHFRDEKFDLILLDPPWRNKYIRRKRQKSSHGYNMMFDEDLKNLNLEELLNNDGLVAVWCTNSSQHFNTLVDNIFPKWGVKFISKWYWLKVTKSGLPVCNFSAPPGKQPFEQLIFGCKTDRKLENPPNKKLILSVPSSLHSHKPPLAELLKMFIPKEPKCLELFARYLLPNWSSYGNEALKFQHECLYDKEEKK